MRAAIPPGAMPSHSPAETPAVRVLPLTVFVHMYKGCTREAHRTNTLAVPDPHESGKPGLPTGPGLSSDAGGSGQVMGELRREKALAECARPRAQRC